MEDDIRTVDCGGYKVFIGPASLTLLDHFLEGEKFRDSRCFILADENTVTHCLPIIRESVSSLRDAEVLEIASGEEHKQIDSAGGLWDALMNLGADRQSVLINLGGGVISDLGGFVAGTYKRGIRYINVPTSLLAQVDASVGSKTGVDHNGVKNLVGLFNPPAATFVFEGFLKTLPRRHLLAGYAEMFKHALIADSGLWDELSELEPSIDGLDGMLFRSIDIKNQIVTQDPLETGIRKKLNFGHTIGHSVESYSLESNIKSLLHGEAVAIGLMCETYISHKAGYIPQRVVDQVSEVLDRLYPRFSMDSLSHHRLIELMRADKKNLKGAINFTLLQDIGKSVIDQQVPVDTIIESLNFYNRLP